MRLYRLIGQRLSRKSCSYSVIQTFRHLDALMIIFLSCPRQINVIERNSKTYCRVEQRNSKIKLQHVYVYRLYSSNYQPALSSRILHPIITQPKLLPSLNNCVLTGINKGPQKGEVQTSATPIFLEVVCVCVAQQFCPVPA